MKPTHHTKSRAWLRPSRFALVQLLLLLLLGGVAARAVGDDDAVPVPQESGDADPSATVKRPEAGSVETLPAPADPVRAGESLRFSVQYGVIKAGTAWLEVPEVKEWDGRKVYNLVARAESNKFFSTMYKVRNRIESYWDKDGLYSHRYFENRREGGHRAKNEINFDYAAHQAKYDNGQTYPIPPEVQDALSSFYYTRTQPLPIGGTIVFDYHASRKTKPMEVKILGRERVKTPAGTFDCVAIEPMLKAGGIFKNKGRLVIWITDDERRMPVLMKSKVMIGSISVVLQEAKLGA
jgi:hypothetical protein